MRLTRNEALTIIGAFLLTAVVIVCTGWNSPARARHHRPVASHAVTWEQRTTCKPGQSCWDCHTMGSHRCGPVVPASMRRPCPNEDSVNCYWNDGGGHPFLVRQFPGSARLVCVMYQGRSYSQRHDYCEGSVSRITCAGIVRFAGYEFPRRAAQVAGICLLNRWRHGSQWQRIGSYDGHRNVWKMVGPTTVYFDGSWFETS